MVVKAPKPPKPPNPRGSLRPIPLRKRPRRSDGMLPPEAVAMQYAKYLRGILTDLQLELVTAAGDMLRADAVGEPFLIHLKYLQQKVLNIGRGAAVDEIAQRVVKKNTREFKKVFGINPRKTEPGISLAIDRFRQENVAKIRSLTVEQIAEFTKVVDRGLAAGTHVNTLRKEIQDRFDVSKSKASLLARDQVLKLNGQITKTRQESVGITEYIWTTARDERVRGNPSGKYPNSPGNHYHLDGTKQRWDDPPIVDETTGRREHPGGDYQCRCVAVPVLGEIIPEDEALFKEATGG